MTALHRFRPRAAGEGDRGAQRRGGGGDRPAQHAENFCREGLNLCHVHLICSRYVPAGPQSDPASRPRPAAEGARPVRRGPPQRNSCKQLSCRSPANPLAAQENPPRRAPRQPERPHPRPAHRRLPDVRQGSAGSNGVAGGQARPDVGLRRGPEARRTESRGFRHADRGAASHRRRLGSAMGAPQ